jgi:hypothetical protein
LGGGNGGEAKDGGEAEGGEAILHGEGWEAGRLTERDITQQNRARCAQGGHCKGSAAKVTAAWRKRQNGKITVTASLGCGTFVMFVLRL